MPLLYRSSINFLSFLETCDDFRRMYAFFSYPRILRFCLDLLLKLRRREDISSKSMKNKEHKRHHIRSSWSCCFLSQDVKYRRCLTVGKEDDKRKPKNKMWLQIRFKLEKGLWKINNEWKIAVNKLRTFMQTIIYTNTVRGMEPGRKFILFIKYYNNPCFGYFRYFCILFALCGVSASLNFS